MSRAQVRREGAAVISAPACDRVAARDRIERVLQLAATNSVEPLARAARAEGAAHRRAAWDHDARGGSIMTEEGLAALLIAVGRARQDHAEKGCDGEDSLQET